MFITKPHAGYTQHGTGSVVKKSAQKAKCFSDGDPVSPPKVQTYDPLRTTRRKHAAAQTRPPSPTQTRAATKHHHKTRPTKTLTPPRAQNHVHPKTSRHMNAAAQTKHHHRIAPTKTTYMTRTLHRPIPTEAVWHIRVQAHHLRMTTTRHHPHTTRHHPHTTRHPRHHITTTRRAAVAETILPLPFVRAQITSVPKKKTVTPTKKMKTVKTKSKAKGRSKTRMSMKTKGPIPIATKLPRIKNRRFE